MTGHYPGVRTSLFHACNPDSFDSIENSGIVAATGFETPPTDDDSYVLPKDVAVEDAFGYATTVVEYALAQERPGGMPSHDQAVFFFASEERAASFGREGVAIIDGDSLADEYDVYAGEYDLIEQLFLDTMRDFEIGYRSSIERVHKGADEYWDTVRKVDIQTADLDDSEVFFPTTQLSSEYVVNTRRLVELGYSPR